MARKELEKRQYAMEIAQYNKDVLAKEKLERQAGQRKSPTLPDMGTLRFQGEDLQGKERQKRQAEQQKEWIAQQILEKQEKLRREKEQERYLKFQVDYF